MSPRKARVAREAAGLTISTADLHYDAEPETISVLESEMGAVQGDDLSNAQPERLEAPPEPEQVPVVVLPHPLEMAPVNSKIVVTSEGAWLAMPDSVALIEGKDPARRLPVGAKILKVPNGYLTSQLSPNAPTEPKFYKTAVEAIQNFVEDHHPRD